MAFGFFKKKNKAEEKVEEVVQKPFEYVEGADAYVTQDGFLVIPSEIDMKMFEISVENEFDNYSIVISNVNNHRPIRFGTVTDSFNNIDAVIEAFGLIPDLARRQQMELNKRKLDTVHPFIKGTYDISNKLSVIGR